MLFTIVEVDLFELGVQFDMLVDPFGEAGGGFVGLGVDEVVQFGSLCLQLVAFPADVSAIDLSHRLYEKGYMAKGRSLHDR